MTDSTLAKIATESLKPVSSALIDALLSAKLKRIKTWAEKKENTDKLNHYRTNILLNDYLNRLLKRVCGITTIVFPQQILPITSIYEPLNLSVRFDNSEEEKSLLFDANSIISGENYLIVDSAGMGKSTFVRHLSLEILNSTIKIPIFLELRRISETETLLQKIAKDIDETQSEVDEIVLSMLLEQGGFVIILDGYDELPEKLHKQIGEQIAELALRCDKNSLILTARPEVTLPEIPNSKVYNIDPLTIKQAESLALRYDKWADIDVGKRLIRQFKNVSKVFLRTPLFIALLYRTYGFNQSIATKITAFYDEIFNALYKGHDLTKSGFAREKLSSLDSEDFKRLLRGFSFLISIYQKNNIKSKSEAVEIIKEAISLTSVQPVSAESFFEDLLSAVPLFVRDGTDFRFIHKSLGEYFSAEFLAYASNTEEIIEHIKIGRLYTTFQNTFQYLSDLNPSVFRRLIAAPIAENIISQKKKIKNPYVYTASILADTYLCLLPLSKYKNRRKDDFLSVMMGLPEVNVKKSSSWSTSILYGKIGRRKYAFVVRKHEIRRFIPAVWDLISKKIDDIDIPKTAFKGNNFTSLDKDFPKEKWVSINSRIVLKHIDNLIILRAFLYACINDYPMRHEIRDARIIDINSCENLIEQIKQDVDAQKWLKLILTKKNQ